MERDDAARERGAPNAAVTARGLPDDLVDRRLLMVVFRPLKIDRRMQ